jgi:hypothetical protein
VLKPITTYLTMIQQLQLAWKLTRFKVITATKGLKIRLPNFFYLLPKIHKTPWKTRPVVSGVSTINKHLSKWIDIQQLNKLSTTSAQPTLKIADNYSENYANYNLYHPAQIALWLMRCRCIQNIDNCYGIKTIGPWLNLHRFKLPRYHHAEQCFLFWQPFFKTSEWHSYGHPVRLQLSYHILQLPQGKSTSSAQHCPYLLPQVD